MIDHYHIVPDIFPFNVLSVALAYSTFSTLIFFFANFVPIYLFVTFAGIPDFNLQIRTDKVLLNFSLDLDGVSFPVTETGKDFKMF